MILTDTNVVSDPLKPVPSPEVRAWFSVQDEYSLYLAAVSQAEILYGFALLPTGRRRSLMEAGFDGMLDDVFGQRILSFDRTAATAFATLVANARRAGHAVSVPDGQIAAIAFVHGFTVATRDTGPFIAMGVPVIDPWLHPA